MGRSGTTPEEIVLTLTEHYFGTTPREIPITGHYSVTPQDAKCDLCSRSQHLDIFNDYALVLLMAPLVMYILYSLKEYFDKARSKEMRFAKSINSIKNAQSKKAEQELQKQLIRENALKKALMTAEKNWKEQKEEPYLDPELLSQLLQIINDDDREVSTIKQDQTDPELSSTSETIETPSKNKFRKSKGVRQPQNRPLQAHIPTDKLMMWKDNLPSYNLTKNIGNDPARPIYRLSSGNRFLFVNRLLLEYLSTYYDQKIKKSLLAICGRKKELNNGSEKQSGFIVDDENIKAKLCTEDFRFYGSMVAKKAGMTLFEINGWKQKHKGKHINYLPSEAKITASKMS